MTTGRINQVTIIAPYWDGPAGRAGAAAVLLFKSPARGGSSPPDPIRWLAGAGAVVLARGGHPPSPSVFPRARSARSSARAIAAACASSGPKEETSAGRGRRGGRPRPDGISRCSVLIGVAQQPVAHRAQPLAQRRVSPAAPVAGAPRRGRQLSCMHSAGARQGAEPPTMIPPRASRSYKPVQGSTQWAAVTVRYRKFSVPVLPTAPPRTSGGPRS
jgi:hypothetical protein